MCSEKGNLGRMKHTLKKLKNAFFVHLKKKIKKIFFEIFVVANSELVLFTPKRVAKEVQIIYSFL